MNILRFHRWKQFTALLAWTMVATLAVAVGLCYRLVMPVDPAEYGDTNSLDAREAMRKIKLFDGAMRNGPHGYIRLSRLELNSLLESRLQLRATNAPTAYPALTRCRVDFNQSTVTLVSWVKDSYFGIPTKLAWQRTGILGRVGDQWLFRPTEMRIGMQAIPERFWDAVTARLGQTDANIWKGLEWLTRSPQVRFTENEMTKQAELRLFTYASSGLLSQATP